MGGEGCCEISPCFSLALGEREKDVWRTCLFRREKTSSIKYEAPEERVKNAGLGGEGGFTTDSVFPVYALCDFVTVGPLTTFIKLIFTLQM